MMRLDGRLEDFEILEVLQAALRQPHASQLLIANDELEGQIRLEGGNIVSAQKGDLAGEEALFDILSWRRGFFSLSTVEEPWPENGNLCWSWTQLLHQAFRRAAQAGPHEIAPLNEAEVEILEQDLGLLFQNLGADIARLADENSDPVALLEGMCEMVNMAVSLSPEQAKRLDFELMDVLPRHGWKGSGLSFIRLEETLINSRAIGQVFGAAAFDPESRRLEARSTARMLAASLDEILIRLAKLLPQAAPSLKAQEKSRTLVSDVQALIRSCPF